MGEIVLWAAILAWSVWGVTYKFGRWPILDGLSILTAGYCMWQFILAVRHFHG